MIPRKAAQARNYHPHERICNTPSSCNMVKIMNSSSPNFHFYYNVSLLVPPLLGIASNWHTLEIPEHSFALQRVHWLHASRCSPWLHFDTTKNSGQRKKGERLIRFRGALWRCDPIHGERFIEIRSKIKLTICNYSMNTVHSRYYYDTNKATRVPNP